MTQLVEEHKLHLANFTYMQSEADGGPAWLDSLRQGARARFEQVGYPSTKQEAWRATNVGAIAKTPFFMTEPMSAAPAGAAELAASFSFSNDALTELVFINGRYSASLSKLSKLPRGAIVGSLAQSLAAGDTNIEGTLAHQASIEQNAFVALNSAFIRDGAFIYLPRNTALAGPVHLLFISVPTGALGRATVSHPRVLVIAEDNVELTLVESYVGAGSQVYFTNAVTEITAGNDCRIDHCKLQQESLSAFHVATMQVELGRQTNFVSHSATVGGKLTRNDLNVMLNGEHAEATLNGLVVIGGDQHCDNHTLLRHEKAHCPSHELYKHVLSGRATGVFKGDIFVQKDAQKTDSKQTSRSLLLSDDASMNSQPSLEIYADDVKCTHGSTTGPVDEEMVFYFRSRGISLEAARHLLTYAFAADVTRRIKVEPVRRRLEDFMAAQHGLPQDLRITDLGSHDEKAR